MAASAQDVQKQIDKGTTNLAQTGTTSYASMVKAHGSNWKNWPKTSHWYIAFSAFAAARAEVAGLVPPPPVLKADFTERQP